MAKQQLINRAKYKDIKRYDHSQMERFARSLYESGFKDGAVQATATEKSNTRQMDFNMLNERLLTIKGDRNCQGGTDCKGRERGAGK